MSNAKINVLFVSLRNTARSVLAQACLEQLGGRRFNAYSCGSPYHLGDAPHPVALQALMNAGMPMGHFECKDWNTFTRNGAIRMHFVITLAEKLSDMVPAWPGQPDTATWIYPDVLRSAELGEDANLTMRLTLLSLRRRIELMASLPMHGSERAALRDDIREMGHMR